MADIPVTQDELALRRRARRRLVGAIAIALTAVVVLPMLFDPEPKPLGPEVDIRIPAQDAPFEPSPTSSTPPAMTPAQDPEPMEAEPTLPTPTKSPGPQQAEAGKKASLDKPDPAQSKPDKPDSAPEKADKPADKVVAKPPAPVKPPAPARPPVPTKASEAAAETGYYLQLGAFSSQTNAKLLQAKVRASGFRVGISDGNGQYRVRVGPVADHAKALDFQEQLKAKGFNPVLVGP